MLLKELFEDVVPFKEQGTYFTSILIQVDGARVAGPDREVTANGKPSDDGSGDTALDSIQYTFAHSMYTELEAYPEIVVDAYDSNIQIPHFTANRSGDDAALDAWLEVTFECHPSTQQQVEDVKKPLIGKIIKAFEQAVEEEFSAGMVEVVDYDVDVKIQKNKKRD